MGSEKVEEQSNGSTTVDDSPKHTRIANKSSSPSSSPSFESNIYFQSKKSKTKKKTGILPPWLIAHLNSRDLKVLFKCWVATWVFTLFIVIEPTLQVIGQATFFGVMVLFIAPPSGVVFTGILAGLTIIIGACLAWAWGSITMKAALATRPTADLQAQYARLQQLGNTTYAQQASGQSTFTQIAIYNGEMLDARVSITYFCMICLFIYLVSRIRIAAPKLTLISIFGMIISDIYLTIGPLIPTFQGTIPRTLIIPAGIAVGMSFVCNILFFPRSTSHLVLDDMQDVLKPMNDFLEACLLNFREPQHQMELDQLKKTKAEVVRAFKSLGANFGFLALDASVGRWGTDDVKSLHDPLRRVLVMFVSLVQVQIGRREHQLRDAKLQELVDFIDVESTTPEKTKDDKSRENARLPVKSRAGIQHMTKLYDYRQKSKHPSGEQLLIESLKALASAGGDLIETTQEAVAAINQSLRLSNTKRWFGRMTLSQCQEIGTQHEAILNTLKQHKTAFAGRAAKDLWESHKHMFDSEGRLIAEEAGYSPPLGGIMLSLVLEERLYNFADALETLLTRLVELEHTRTRVRLWLPGNLQNLIIPWALKKDISPIDMSNRSEFQKFSSSEEELDQLKQEKEEAKKEMKKKEKKEKKDKKKSKANDDRDADGEETAASQLRKMNIRGVAPRSAFGRFLINTYHWFAGTEGMYALRILVVTIALGVPAVIPSSAGFYYREKGLWGLIMAQTALLPYTADFVASFFLRIAGTIVGAIVGLLMWYIGAGHGPGNSYGMAAISAPVLLVFMWLRLFTSPAYMQGVILMVATSYLVMCYSWVDTHIPSYGNPGVGYSVFWRRMVLVMVGFSAAAIVTFFPRPPSASRHYRRLIAESLQTVKNQYALFALNCQSTSSPNYHKPPSDLKSTAETTAVDTSDILLEIEPSIPLLKFEFSSSNFDAQTLSRVCHICMNLNQTVSQLLIYATDLPSDLQDRFLLFTGATEESALVADIMAVLTLLQQTLKTGDPLPAVLPVPLVVRSMEGAKIRTSDNTDGVTGHIKNEHAVHLNEEKLADEMTRRYCSAMSAFVQFLSGIDEMVVVVKRAVGETTWAGLNESRSMSRSLGRTVSPV